MKARFFYSGFCKGSWPKLFVLKEDGILFCEYLSHWCRQYVRKPVDYETFKAVDYAFGGYQKIKEISYEEAINTKLVDQKNWVQGYLDK